MWGLIPCWLQRWEGSCVCGWKSQSPRWASQPDTTYAMHCVIIVHIPIEMRLGARLPSLVGVTTETLVKWDKWKMLARGRWQLTPKGCARAWAQPETPQALGQHLVSKAGPYLLLSRLQMMPPWSRGCDQSRTTAECQSPIRPGLPHVQGWHFPLEAYWIVYVAF